VKVSRGKVMGDRLVETSIFLRKLLPNLLLVLVEQPPEVVKNLGQIPIGSKMMFLFK
jgi:hypothetical protein